MPSTKAPLRVSVGTRTELLSKTYTVTVTGEPGAKAAISIDGRAWKTVTLNGSGSATASTTSLDLLGLLGGLASSLGAGDFTARYA